MVFLTGATGLLGSQVLYDILTSTDWNVACLVRCNSESSGWQRVVNALRDVTPDYCPQPNRLRIVPGNISQPRLGLSESVARKLLARVERLVHIAANTNLVGKESDLMAANVAPMDTLIGFAEATKSRHFHYVSSFSVVGDRLFERDFVFDESMFDVGQRFPLMPYQKSKFLAEKKLRESDLNWSISRPGQIFGHSQTGHYPEHLVQRSVFNDFVTSMFRLQTVPDSSWLFDMSPVDRVARGIVELGLNPENSGRCFHLIDKSPLRVYEFKSLFQELGISCRLVSIAEFQRLMASLTPSPPSLRSLQFWMKGLKKDFAERVQVSCRDTEKLLGFGLSSDHRQLLQSYRYLFQ